MAKIALGVTLDTPALRKLYFEVLGRLRPDVCCDIGANNGEAALLAKDAAPEADVYAFEANPEIFRLHRARLESRSVHYFNLAITDRSSDVTIYAPHTLSKAWDDGKIIDAHIIEPPETGKTSLLLRNEVATYTEFTVPAQSLDRFFTKQDRDIPYSRFALWIDVEGAADLVLRGAEAVLKNTGVIFVEVEGYPFWKKQTTAEGVREFLGKHDFVPVARDREYGDDQFNILFVHEAFRESLADILPRSVSYPASDIPVLVPVFNNPTYLRRMIQQLSDVGLEDVVIVDNGSSFAPHLEYLDSLEQKFTVIRRKDNRGPRHLFQDAAFYEPLPQHFCTTDPDLEFNPDLPSRFLQHLVDLTSKYQVGKAGFSLDISDPAKMIAETFQIGDQRYRIWEWEAQFWQTRLRNESDPPAYRAQIDTTFALYNKAFFRPENFLEAIRVAGNYTARHLPWYSEQRIPPDEAAFYRTTSRHSFYTGTAPLF